MWWVRVILVLLFPISLLIQQGSSSTTTSACPPSSCGKISNISYPFRLKDDPIHCGDKRYELSCENNVTTLNLFSGKYYVKSINYNNFTIRLVDIGIQQNNCSSLPLYFLTQSDFCVRYNYIDKYCTDPYQATAGEDSNDNFFEHIVYLNCTHQVTNNPKYVNTTSCFNWHSNKHYYIYAMAGDLIAQDFQVGCHVKLITPTSWLRSFQGNEVVSYDVIHKALEYGFEISWLRHIFNDRCKGIPECFVNTSTERLQCVCLCHSFLGGLTDTCGKYYLSTKLINDIFIQRTK